ncbi:formyl transferase [Kordiimonas sp. SCSIO 12610]|uniref:formyl transferase n=1 Tax=Kordiimonas sp. SCSIO 12610 TaxID=2829597 RepID=UPI00210BE59C|nr:formyl transferase [Kordiimonas sp. SCSIO 12610]UTW55877.1 hypothetical protein KFF44_03005 [Kordiimonas sp. SCSIO 12610]
MSSESSKKPRLVVLTTDSYEQRYVANHLSARFDIQAILIDKKIYNRKKKSYFRHGLLNFLGKASRIIFFKLIDNDRKRSEALVDILGEKSLSFENPSLIQPVEGLNTSETASIIKQHNPDAILVYGTRIVQDKILHLATDLAFNMHTGISPHYRGTACAFWPIVNNDLEMLGATVHECTSAVDGGKIFETETARLEKGDNIYAAFARAVIAGTEAYVNVIENYMNDQLNGYTQDLSIGKEYRGYELTIVPEIKARLNLRKFNKS